MKKKLTPELKKLKTKLDFLAKEICELEWKRATIFYGQKAVFQPEIDQLEEQIENYSKNKEYLIEEIRATVQNANHKK